MCYMFCLFFVTNPKPTFFFPIERSKKIPLLVFSFPHLKKEKKHSNLEFFSMEEFSSNESGWTKYLGSPSLLEENCSSGIEDGEYNYYYHQGRDRNSRNGGVKHKKNEDNEDDSITSDASSGLRKARGINAGECSSKYNAGNENEEYYRLIKGDKICKEVKGKAGNLSTMVSKGKGALKQKRGKKTN